ncbi:efflux RND transporter periplasmic adaptor subunit [Aquisalimonas asiatica]|uniref:HlyD family secretion protein n=1 Tax=Aquisalimonas asiatica TaxID=406100 RepID=A0A1H8RIM1_9GAMM|nr:efflux RND transporter periplasmic adaptor subunit [Aquisalimonas asiatica]SEO65853.1 HlyD family secretion protein [Aquisalimonas asiatica]
MTLRKKLILTLLAVAVIGLLGLALWPAPVPVSTVTAERGHFAETVEDEGRTRLPDPHTVSAPITGYLRRVTLEPGDGVTAGQTLLELEPTPAPALDARSRSQAREATAAARARLDAAEAELEARQIQHQLARSEDQRYQQMYDRELVSTEQMERIRAQRESARTAERSARHAVDVARFELDAARAVLEIADGERAPGDQPRLQVPSPIDGVVTRRHRYSEGPVNAGDPVLDVGDLSTLEVQVDLLSMDAVRVRPGMAVTLERWGGSEDLQGEVRRVEPGGFLRVSALGVDEQRVPVRVAITSPREAWEALGDGFRVEARFILWEDDDVLQVPTSALFRSDGQWSVYVVSNGRADRRPIEPGRRSGLQTQILDGLASGERVITHPGDRVSDGARVRADD